MIIRENTYLASNADGTLDPDQLLNLVRELLDVWHDLSSHKLQIRRVSAAMTNAVFIVNVESIDEPHSLLVRLYGSPSQMMIFRERQEEQCIVSILAQHGLCPRWWAIFGNGRLEEFIPSAPLTAVQFRTPEIVGLVMEKLAKLHGMREEVVRMANLTHGDELWDRLRRWHKMAIDHLSKLDGGDLGEEFKTILTEEMLNDLRDRCNHLLSAHHVVFAHCDLHHGNVLKIGNHVTSNDDRQGGDGNDRNSDGKQSPQDSKHHNPYMLIDYEYALVTERAFDLANFFSEFMFDYDDERDPGVANLKHFPTLPQQRHLLTLYLCQIDGASSNNEMIIDDLLRDIQIYLSVVQWHWLCWAIVQASSRSSGRDDVDGRFNYLRCAQNRLDLFNQFYSRSSPRQ